MMKNKDHINSQYVAMTFISIAKYLIVGLVVLIAILIPLFKPKPDPLDHSVLKKREYVNMFEVTDSLNNGFRITYATRTNVTQERLEEILSRDTIRSVQDRLKREAPLHFGTMLDVDIYDFAEFALRYDVDSDIVIHNIFVYGKEKVDLYIGPNPRIADPATWINPETRQGVQYITQNDIYGIAKKAKRIYRYWKCNGNNKISFTDERYSHFSKDEISR